MRLLTNFRKSDPLSVKKMHANIQQKLRFSVKFKTNISRICKMFDKFQLNIWDLRSVEICALSPLCRYWRKLSNEASIAKGDIDPAEKSPRKLFLPARSPLGSTTKLRWPSPHRGTCSSPPPACSWRKPALPCSQQLPIPVSWSTRRARSTWPSKPMFLLTFRRRFF